METSDIGKEHIRYKGEVPEAVECPECGFSHPTWMPASPRQPIAHVSGSPAAPIKFPHLHAVLLPLFLCSLGALVIAGIIVLTGIDFPWRVKVTRPWSQGGGTYIVEFPWVVVGAIMISAFVSYVYKKSVS
jgi:hypothetical protein